MSDIDNLASRVSTALERIRTGLGVLDERLAEAAAPPPDDAALEAAEARADDLASALDDERTANAQLSERVKSLNARLAESEAEAEAAGPSPEEQAAIAALDGHVQQLQQANAALREVNAGLRAALKEGLADPALINTALESDLAALTAARAAESAEIAALLAKLAPLMKEPE